MAAHTTPTGIRGIFRIVPHKDESEETVVLEEFGIMLVPKKEYKMNHDLKEMAKNKYRKWSDGRVKLIKEMNEMAEKCDDTQFGTNIANVAGAGVGIAGGVLTFFGLFAPPLLIAGVPMLIGAGANGVVTPVTKMCVLSSRGNHVKKIVEDEKELLKEAIDALERLQALQEKKSQALAKVEGGRTGLQVATDVMTGVNCVPSVAVGLARVAIKESMTTGANVLKGFSYAFLGVGVALDAISAITTAVDMADGSRSGLAAEIRKAAAALGTEKTNLDKLFKEYCAALD